ncbi:MAG: hypothetical protein ABIT37_25685 [Luteolibacter sp.]
MKNALLTCCVLPLVPNLRAASSTTGFASEPNEQIARKLRTYLGNLVAGVTWIVTGLTFTSPVHAVDLYSTGFNNPPFVLGVNTWAGTDGWMSNDTVAGIQGIVGDSSYQEAYLGFNTTSAASNYVYRKFNYDPVIQQNPMVDFGMDIAIRDSTNGKYDKFHLQIYNSAGEFLGGMYFSNSDLHIFKADGVTATDTGVKFTNDIRQRLTFSINFATNMWSASHNGTPLFTNSSFHGGTKSLNFGDITYLWAVATTGSPGNNYLTVDNLTISATSGGSPYATWQAGFFNSTQLANPAISGDNVDFDKDGIANLLEYLLGGSPTLPDSGLLPTLATTPVSGGRNLIVSYKRKLAATGVTYLIESNSALSSTWIPAIHGQNGVTIITTPVDAQTEQITATIPTAGAMGFARLRATR